MHMNEETILNQYNADSMLSPNQLNALMESNQIFYPINK